MIFKDLNIGDTFDVEENNGCLAAYIKIDLVKAVNTGFNHYYNSVCIDECSGAKGKLAFFYNGKKVSHKNWS